MFTKVPTWMTAWALAALLLAPVIVAGQAQAQEAGFGGAADTVDDEVVIEVYDADAPSRADDPDSLPPIDGEAPAALPALPARDEFVGGAGGRTLAVFPDPEPPPPPEKTPLEIELDKARLDPAQHPLLAMRVEVARAWMNLRDIQSHGLVGAREQEANVESLRAILADIERIALHRMNVCMTRQGKAVVVKNYRMTPAGAVRLSTQELLAQTSNVDPDGCGRIFLIDEAVVTRVKRAHELKTILETVKFGYHEVAQRRAYERELTDLQRELAKEDLPLITMPGGTDPYGH